MHVHRSNRSERLVDELAAILRRPLADPMVPEIVAVQSKGMERWLGFELSARMGVFANAELPFPRHLLSRLFHDILDDDEALAAPFAEQALAWTIAAVLSAQLGHAELEPIAHYLEADRDGALRMQLAARLARAFDDYAVYRPELLPAWERGEGRGYEPRIFRAVVERHGPHHQAARAERFMHALANGNLPASALPERLCVFGVSSLPPLYLEALSALSERVETHLFVLSPCRQYWADLRRRRSPAAEPETEGHPLLLSLGRLGRDLQGLLEVHTSYHESDEDLYVDPGTGCLLHALQSDMLSLRNRGSEAGPSRLALADDDDSVSIAVCHGPMREIEVLHDQLAALLERGDLEPHQIVVMAPDIERYAPMIDAVFSAETGRPRIPFSVADRSTRATHTVVDSLHAVLDALRSRLTASTIIDLFGQAPIRERADISAEELVTLRRFIERSGVRWGLDAEHRAELGLPRTDLNTWRFGLDRLLLGLALPERSQALFGGALPLAGAQGEHAELLGKLGAFCDRLGAFRKIVVGGRAMAEWRELLASVLSELIAVDSETVAEHELVLGALRDLCEDAASAGFEDTLPLVAVLALLDARLDARLPARGLLARGVTFCQLVPMRSIPFEVVCLLGMNDDGFPRPSTQLGFERGTEHGQPRPGDRSARDDDRHMFLEALLCARRRLLVSYVGRGIQDNRVRPPSVVVGELLDAIERGFFPAGTEAEQRPEERRRLLRSRLCVEHRLHGFSPRYFDESDPRFFSFHVQACEAARAMRQVRASRQAVAPPLHTADVPDDLLPQELQLDELEQWITRPCRQFAQRRLGLYLADDKLPLADRESLELTGLERWTLATTLLQDELQGTERAALLAAATARGDLPHGTPGVLLLHDVIDEVDQLAAAVRAARGGSRLPPLAVSLERTGVSVVGLLHDLFPAAACVGNYSREGGRFELASFVRHVALCSQLARTPQAGLPQRTIIICRAPQGAKAGLRRIELAPLSDPHAVMSELISIWAAAQRTPLPFDYEASRAYVEAILAKKDPERALTAARKAFEGKRAFPERDVRHFFPSFDALLDAGPLDFATVAERVFRPLLGCRSSA